MPIQVLKLNPNFDPSSLKAPPSVEPTPGALSTTQSPLCLGCRQYFERPPRVWTGPGLREVIASDEPIDDDASRQVALACLHSEALSTVFDNARAGTCHYCTLVCARLIADHKHGESIRLLRQHHQARVPVDHRVRTAVVETSRNGFSLHVDVGQMGDPPLFWVSMWVISDIKTSVQTVGRPLTMSTAHEATFEIARAWLTTCLDRHTHCKALVKFPDLLPTRLLDLNEADQTGKVVLHETEPQQAPYQYIVLSHCWGKSQRLQLTKHSIHDFRNGLSMKSSAKTFQDAVEITRRLGLRYIWIDCLCIIQDSPEDWTNEAAKMAGIYGNAVCCVAASASSDSQGGCFRKRNPLEVQPIRFEQFPFSPGWETETSRPILIAAQDITKAWKWCRGPLDDRGWILQEQMLAPRTLYYSETQVFWECRMLTASEVWPDGIPNDPWADMSAGQTKIIYDTASYFGFEASSGYAVGDKELVYRRWEKIVSWYTARSFTDTGDKLLALAGIADVTMSLTQDRYLAGLWGKDLLRGLAWKTLPEYRPSGRPIDYRAPTWSWASTDGRVCYDDVSKHTRDMVCTIYDADTGLLDDKLTGRVKDGRLAIGGLMRVTRWAIDQQKPSGMQLIDEASKRWLDTEVNVFPDFQTTDTTNTIYLLRLYRSHSLAPYGSPLGRNRIHGLILSPLDNNREIYQRIGYFSAVDYGYTKIASEGWNHFISGWDFRRIEIV